MASKDSMNFSYVLPGVVAGMALPGRYENVDEDLLFVRDQGIGAILTLTEDRLPVSDITRNGFEYLHLPVRDFTAPSQTQIETAVDFIKKNRAHNRATAVHCYAGIGRTGTILACYLVSCGYSAVQAIQKIRRIRPGSIQGDDQENSIFLYEQMVSK